MVYHYYYRYFCDGVRNDGFSCTNGFFLARSLLRVGKMAYEGRTKQSCARRYRQDFLPLSKTKTRVRVVCSMIVTS